MFPRFCTRPTGGHAAGQASAHGADVRSKPTFSIVLPSNFLHVIACAGRRGEWGRFRERLLRLICHLNLMQGDVVHRFVIACEARAFVHGRLGHAHAARVHTTYD